MSAEITYPDRRGDALSSGARIHVDAPRSFPGDPDDASVTRELELILASSFFHASKRSQQFLKFVVQYRLDRNQEPLKERTIGAVLYNRPADYATGDDSVVRVQAGEVRRRLEQYYQVPPAGSLVRIELPVGLYVPEFKWASTSHAEPGSHFSAVEDSLPGGAEPATVSLATHPRWKKRTVLAGIAIALAAAAGLGFFWTARTKTAPSVLHRFWSPVFESAGPVLICLPKTVLYRPSAALYKRHEKTPGEFDTEVARMNAAPDLQPNEVIHWGDMIDYTDFGVGKGDVKAAFRLASMLEKQGKNTELRIGSDYTWDDLRNSPSVLIGAFSNQSTMRITSSLHFRFAEDNGFAIEEQGPHRRVWHVETTSDGESVDYGLVTRLVNSTTGQFMVCTAGIMADGSEAAAELASSNSDLEAALRNASPDWEHKNIQIVVNTIVTDHVAGPAHIVAVYAW